MARSRRPQREDPFPIVRLSAALIAVLLVTVVFVALGQSPEPEEPVFTEESCAERAPRYALAVGVDPGGLWIWTADGERRIDCHAVANCAGPDSYDWQELQRRLSLARSLLPEPDAALLLAEDVDVELTLRTAAAMRSDPAHGDAPLFGAVAMGDPGCREVVQAMLVPPPAPAPESEEPQRAELLQPGSP